MLFNATGEVAVLAVVGVRFELGIDRAQPILLFQYRTHRFLKGNAADAAGAVRLYIPADDVADDFRCPIRCGKHAADNLTVFPGGCAQPVDGKAAHRVTGFGGDSLLHLSQGKLGGHHNTDSHNQQQRNNQGIEFETQ